MSDFVPVCRPSLSHDSELPPMTSTPRRLCAGALAVLSLSIGGLATAAPAEARAAAPPPKVKRSEGSDVTRSGTVPGEKAPSARLAKTSPAVLKATGNAPTRVVVKFDYDSIAAYRGGINGLPATSPAATNQPVTTSVATRSAY